MIVFRKKCFEIVAFGDPFLLSARRRVFRLWLGPGMNTSTHPSVLFSASASKGLGLIAKGQDSAQITPAKFFEVGKTICSLHAEGLEEHFNGTWYGKKKKEAYACMQICYMYDLLTGPGYDLGEDIDMLVTSSLAQDSGDDHSSIGLDWSLGAAVAFDVNSPMKVISSKIYEHLESASKNNAFGPN